MNACPNQIFPVLVQFLRLFF